MKTRTNKFQKSMPHLKSKSKRVSIRKCLMEKMERKTEFAVLPPQTRKKNLHSFKGLFFCCHLMKFHFLFWQKQMVNNVSMPSTLKVSKFQKQILFWNVCNTNDVQGLRRFQNLGFKKCLPKYLHQKLKVYSKK